VVFAYGHARFGKGVVIRVHLLRQESFEGGLSGAGTVALGHWLSSGREQFPRSTIGRCVRTDNPAMNISEWFPFESADRGDDLKIVEEAQKMACWLRVVIATDSGDHFLRSVQFVN
jgi:hypothetical protein